MRVSRTHQDIRRVTHTGGVHEESLTSLTPETQDRFNTYILYTLSQHFNNGVERDMPRVRTNKVGKYVMKGIQSVIAVMRIVD